MKKPIFVLAFILAACVPPPNAQIESPSVPKDAAASADINETKEAWVNPYPSYCFERVGQIGADGNQDALRRGDVCKVHGGGAGGRMEDLPRPERNTASIHISAPSLEAVGMKSFSFTLNRGSQTPVFFEGVHVMDQARIEIFQTGADLPDRLGFGSDLTGRETMFTHTAPDAAHLRANAGGFDFPGYEIASAVLTINTATDVPIDAFEAEFALKSDMVMGEQYVAGTLTISFIPMGSTGQQYGPTTFEFGRTIGWGYNKSLHAGK